MTRITPRLPRKARMGGQGIKTNMLVSHFHCIDSKDHFLFKDKVLVCSPIYRTFNRT